MTKCMSVTTTHYYAALQDVKQLLCGVQDILYSLKGTGMLNTSGESWSL